VAPESLFENKHLDEHLIRYTALYITQPPALSPSPQLGYTETAIFKIRDSEENFSLIEIASSSVGCYLLGDYPVRFRISDGAGAGGLLFQIHYSSRRFAILLGLLKGRLWSWVIPNFRSNMKLKSALDLVYATEVLRRREDGTTYDRVVRPLPGLRLGDVKLAVRKVIFKSEKVYNVDIDIVP
jgi:hypothetical protein